MGTANDEKTSSRDKSIDDDKEMHKRKRGLTRKLDRRLLPLLSYAFNNY
jgi:hypothetical protein